VEEMNEGLVENWNNIVTPQDTIYHLGDVAFLNKSLTIQLCQRLNGYKVLVMGNHDLKNPVTWWKNEAGFDEVYKLGYGVTHEAQGFSLCHYPYRKSLTEYDERTYLHHHAPASAPSFLLHGHVHDRWRVNARQINVGVDVWNCKPVPLVYVQHLAHPDIYP
jgi:calcineurin-like phosphoesterase family protein